MANPYDVVIVGGGIHGVGVAQAAAAAGYKALLLEKTAVAHGTSSRSSKLIHGGLRYLETFQLGLVRESLRERAILLAIAPDLVRRVPFHIPVYRRTRRRPWQIRTGLSLYALLGNLRQDSRFRVLPRNAWDRLDGLRTDDLQVVFRYWDAQTDDAALTRSVLASAARLGAEVICPARFLGAERLPDGYQVRYEQDGAARECRCLALVNAGGPWAHLLQDLIRPCVPAPQVDLVQGAHIVLNDPVQEGVYYVEAPRDRRAVFVMPWRDPQGRWSRTLVGTTETSCRGEADRPTPLPDEISYLQETFSRYFPPRDATVLSSFAGLRVLPYAPGAAFHRPREVILSVDDPSRPRFVGIYGGKLTGYRATAIKVMRLLAHSLPPKLPAADTALLRLSPP